MPLESTKTQAMQAEWERFCDELKALGEVAQSDVAHDELDVAEGYRYLTRLLRLALEMRLEHASADHPSFYSLSHETAKIGADNPDNVYLNANVDGRFDYEITGHLGDVPYLSIGTKENRYATDGRMISTGEIDLGDIAVDEDGRVRIVVSAREHEDSWLPMTERSNMVIVRQTFGDRRREEPARLEIRRIGGGDDADRLDFERAAAALQGAMGFVKGTANTFLDWVRRFERDHHGRFELGDQAFFQAAGGDPNICYLYAYWELAPGEVLRIETPVPECESWNFQLTNVWMESLDYRHHRVHLNGELADQPDPKRLVIHVTHAPAPGLENNVITTGHERGIMLIRWIGASEHPIPELRRIDAGALD